MTAREPSFGIRILSCYIAWSFFMAPMAALAEPVAALDDGVSGAEARDPLPPGSLTVGALYTEDYWEGIGDVLVPLFFDGQGLLFVNPRTSRTDNDASEFNVGLGYRRLIREREAIVGGNLYYDYRDTTAGAQFHQLGAGLEYLSKRLDLRANIYAPTETREKINEFSTTETSTSRRTSREIRADYDDPYATGHTVQQDFAQISLTRTTTTTLTTTRFYEQYEIAFWGWDAEIGTEWSIPGLDDLVRIKPFAGVVNYYGRSGVSDIEAFRGRLEVHVGPSFFLDAVYLSDDSLNGGNFAVGAYLSLPFEIGNIAQGRNPFSGATEARYAGSGHDVSWRLGEMVKRDPQIRAAVAAPEERKDKTTSTAETTRSTSTKDLGTGTAVILADVTFVNNENAASPEQDGTAENPYDSVQEGVDNANSPVWVYTGNAPYEETVEVPEGVQLYGQGTTIEALGGKTWGGGTHPVLIGQDAAPVVTILGNNTAVSGFDIRHGALPGGSVIDPVTSKNVAYAGIYGSQVSNVQIHDNIMNDGSLSYGIFVANNGLVPGGNINLVGTFLGNTIRNVSEDGLYVYGMGGGGSAGSFDIQASGDYSMNGGSGIYVSEYYHDTARAHLHDITANGNTDYGMTTRLHTSDLSWLRLDRVTANNNTKDGIYGIKAYAENGAAHVELSNVAANDNHGSGISHIHARAEGDACHATVELNNVTANNNDSEMGIEYIYAWAYGTDGDAIITLNNVDVSDNRYGLYFTRAYSADGGSRIAFTDVAANNTLEAFVFIGARAFGDGHDATIQLNNVQANNNTWAIRQVSAQAYGAGGDAIVEMNNIQANNNTYAIRQVSAEAFGAGGDAIVEMNNIQANDNTYGGIDYVYAYSYGDGGDASIALNNVETSNNQDDGIGYIAAQADDGAATVNLSGITARYNDGYGAETVTATAGGTGDDALITFIDSDLRDNTTGGYNTLTPTATGGGTADTDVQNVQQ